MEMKSSKIVACNIVVLLIDAVNLVTRRVGKKCPNKKPRERLGVLIEEVAHHQESYQIV